MSPEDPDQDSALNILRPCMKYFQLKTLTGANMSITFFYYWVLPGSRYTPDIVWSRFIEKSVKGKFSCGQTVPSQICTERK